MHARKQSDDLLDISKHGSEENEELGPTIDSDKINRLHAKGQQGLAKGGRSFEEVHKAGVVASPRNVDNKNKSLREAEVEPGQKKTEEADDGGNDTKVEAKMRTPMQRAKTSQNTNKNSTHHKGRAEGERLAVNINVTRQVNVNGNVNESEKSTNEDNRKNSDKEDDKDNDNNKEEHNGNTVGKNSEKGGVSTDIKKQGERMESMIEEPRRKVRTHNSINVKDGFNEAIKKEIVDVLESHKDPRTSEINLDLITDEELESSLMRNQMSKKIEILEEVEEEENMAETQPSSGSTLNPLIKSPPDLGDHDVHEHLHNGVSEGNSMSTVLANEKVAVKEEEEEREDEEKGEGKNEEEEDVENELNSPRSLTLVEKARALGLEVSITSSPSLFFTIIVIRTWARFSFV